MLKRFQVTLFAILLVLVLFAPCGAAELVTNGGFETGNFNNWTVTNASSGSLIAVNAIDPHTGTYAASFGATGTQDDSISQTLATVAGQSYTFSFWLAHPYRNSTPNDFTVSWNGTSLIGGATPGLPLANAAVFAYTQYAFTEIAGSLPTVITFSGLENPAYFYLDDVSVSGPQSVPEPMSLLLFGFGLVGMALIKKITEKRRHEMKTSVSYLVLAFWVVGGLLLTPGFSFAQAAPGIQIFDDDVNGISYTLYGTSFNPTLAVTQETATRPGSLIWDFDYSSGFPPATYSYNIYEPGTNLLNPPASALSDTLQFTRSGGGAVGAHGHLEFFSGPLNEAFLLSPLTDPNAISITETGFLQTPPNPPTDLLVFQFQSDLDAPTNVPEPASLLLFGFGLVGIAGIGRKIGK